MRAINRAACAVIALLLLAVSVLTLVELVLSAFSQPPWLVKHHSIAADLTQRPWQDTATRLVCVALAVLGLALFYLGAKRGTPADIALDPGIEGITMTVSSRSLERYLSGIAGSEPGVARSSARARKKKVAVTAETPQREPGELQQRVERAVAAKMDALRPTPPIKTSATVRRREG